MLICVLALLAALAGPQTASARSDLRAIRAYLKAEIRLLGELIDGVPAGFAAARTAAAAITASCPQAFAMAPAASLSITGSTSPLVPQSQNRQLSELEDEAGEALNIAYTKSQDGAYTQFIQTLKSLSWSAPSLRDAAQRSIRGLERPLPVLDVCADIAVWAASGYRTLSAQTARLSAARSGGPGLGSTISRLVARRGSARERAMLRRIERLVRRLNQALHPLGEVDEHLKASLGLGEPGDTLSAEVTIGHGVTSAGTKFTARVVPAVKLCQPILQIEETAGRLVAASLQRTCYFGALGGDPPTVECDYGLLKVEARMPASARSARLLLSNGRQIASRALIMPANVSGGPASFYYEVVRGPTPTPVSLTELDENGQTIMTLPLPSVRRCAGSPF